MPIGIPGRPDLAASTASIASARMELASSASLALAVTGESIGAGKLYSAGRAPPFLQSRRLRASRPLRHAGRSALVRLPRRRASGGNGAARAVERRPARQGAAGLGQAAVARTPQLAGV